MSRRTPKVRVARPVFVAFGHLGQMLDPALAAGRMKKAIFNGNPVGHARMQLPPPVQHGRAILRVQMASPEVDDLRPALQGGRDAEHRPELVVNKIRLGFEAGVVEAEAGDFGRCGESRGRIVQPPFASLARQRVGEYLGQHAQALQRRTGPVTLRPQGIESQCADVRFTADGQRQRQTGLDAQETTTLPVDRGLLRKAVEARHHHRAPCRHLCHAPGKLFLVERPCRGDRPSPRVAAGWDQLAGSGVRPLPEHGQIEVEQLAHATQGIVDLAIDVAGFKVDKARGDLGDQLLEFLACFHSIDGGTVFRTKHCRRSWDRRTSSRASR